MNRICKRASSFIYFIIESFFPSRCLGCRKRGISLCDMCADNLRPNERETPSRIFAVFDYRDPVVRRIIWNLKYKKHAHLGIEAGKLLYERTIEYLADINSISRHREIIVVPVPLSPHRLLTRGYNQAERIAVGFCKNKEEQYTVNTRLVKKIKDTNPQARIHTRSARLSNIHGAFQVKDKAFCEGKTIIVIDDVTTTGGTLKEIMSCVKKAGAKNVFGFALAH